MPSQSLHCPLVDCDSVVVREVGWSCLELQRGATGAGNRSGRQAGEGRWADDNTGGSRNNSPHPARPHLARDAGWRGEALADRGKGGQHASYSQQQSTCGWRGKRSEQLYVRLTVTSLPRLSTL